MISKKYAVEAFGTAVLVLLGCGSAVLAGDNVGYLGIAFAFGLSVVAMVYAIGHISGCHINPAVTLGFCLSGQMRWSEGAWYMVAQLIGGVLGALLLYVIATNVGITNGGGLGANGWSGDVTILGAFLTELIMTFIFVRVVLGSTSPNGAGALAGLAIGLTLVLIHIVTIPVTGTSVNPARSFGPAVVDLFNGNGVPMGQLWLFFVAPLL